MSCLSISELSPEQMAKLSVERVERLLAEHRAVQCMCQSLRIVHFTSEPADRGATKSRFERFAPASEGDPAMEIRA